MPAHISTLPPTSSPGTARRPRRSDSAKAELAFNGTHYGNPSADSRIQSRRCALQASASPQKEIRGSLSGFPSQSAYNTIFVYEKERSTSSALLSQPGKGDWLGSNSVNKTRSLILAFCWKENMELIISLI